MHMFKYILKRIGFAILTFAIIMLVCFILVKLAPETAYISLC